ncbi:MAG: RNA polymerase sigma factor RpoD/SigA [Armatimonadota bacterium]
MEGETLELSDRYKGGKRQVAAISDSMDMYLNRIGRRPLLSHAKEMEIARLAAAGDTEAKKTLIECNLKLVVSIAKMYSRSGIPLPDLIQEGNIGLIKAVESFDYTRGFRFSTYAVAWIRQAITRSIERHGRTIRVPSYVIQSIRKLHRLQSSFMNEYGHDPSIDELSQQAGLTQTQIMKLLESSEGLVSLDECISEDGSTALIEKLIDATSEDPEARALRQENAEIVTKLVAGLSTQEKLIIEKRFGLDNGATSTLQEIGQQLHITRERVRQLEARALKKLRIAATRNRLDGYFVI